MKSLTLTIVFILISLSCSPSNFLLNRTILLSIYFDRKIDRLTNQDDQDLQTKRKLIQTKIEYAYGVLMEKGDRLVDEDYTESMKFYNIANQKFTEAKNASILLLSKRYPDFNKWMRKEHYIQFDKKDINDMYWLSAALAGSIQSSRGSNPHELINIPTIGRLLNAAISLDQNWRNGALYSAMMSYSAVRPDLGGKALIDTVDYYFEKALQLSDSTDASIYVGYAESINIPRQEKKAFDDKLNFVIAMDINKNKNNKINNIISKRRAEWLLSKTNDLFIE